MPNAQEPEAITARARRNGTNATVLVVRPDLPGSAAEGAPAALLDVKQRRNAASVQRAWSRLAQLEAQSFGRITRIYAIPNPHKLERLGEVANLRR